MTAHRLTVLIRLAFAFMLLSLSTAVSIFAADKPNIVVIYTDDQGYGDMSALNPGASSRLLTSIASHAKACSSPTVIAPTRSVRRRATRY